MTKNEKESLKREFNYIAVRMRREIRDLFFKDDFAYNGALSIDEIIKAPYRPIEIRVILTLVNEKTIEFNSDTLYWYTNHLTAFDLNEIHCVGDIVTITLNSKGRKYVSNIPLSNILYVETLFDEIDWQKVKEEMEEGNNLQQGRHLAQRLPLNPGTVPSLLRNRPGARREPYKFIITKPCKTLQNLSHLQHLQDNEQ